MEYLQRVANGHVDTEGNPLLSHTNRGQERTRPSGKAVLGKEILTAIHDDMSRIELPAWVNPAPSGFGLKSNGKLSADQWRTVCLVNLPFTLIRLWSGTGRRADMLNNFMQLVTAVEAGSMLTTNPFLIEFYNTTMLDYLSEMKSLYPEAKIKPNHHYALHLGDFLEAFGPVHSWRTFAFERYNYLMQQVNTNKQFGKQ